MSLDTRLGAGNPEAVKYSLGKAEPATGMTEAEARKLLSDVLRDDGYLICAEKALTCDYHNIRISHAVAAILRAANTNRT